MRLCDPVGRARAMAWDSADAVVVISKAQESPFMRTHLCRGTMALLLALAAPVCWSAGPANPAAVAWQDSFTTRLEALALLQTLNSDLLSHDSATLTLDRWCAAHRLSDPPTITAERVHDVDKPATAAQRELLQVSATEPLGYRRVRLHCGAHVLSEADNWYVPSRLTVPMNEALNTTDIAFGRAVQALQFRRRTLSAALLWTPLPEGWELAVPANPVHSGKLAVPPTSCSTPPCSPCPMEPPSAH
jgi:chorismate-pyruvate lyase